jgi:hypothetical protein
LPAAAAISRSIYRLQREDRMSIFASLGISTIWLIAGVLVIGWIWLLFHNTEAGLRVGYNVGRVIVAIVKGLFKALILLFSAIGRFIARLFNS